MGFKDGTANIKAEDGEAMDRFVWVGGEGPAWMRGGSYMVTRRIRMLLEIWDRSALADQPLLHLLPKDPERQFVAIQRRLGSADALNEYIKHVGSAVFAVPPGARQGGYVGETLLG